MDMDGEDMEVIGDIPDTDGAILVTGDLAGDIRATGDLDTGTIITILTIMEEEDLPPTMEEETMLLTETTALVEIIRLQEITLLTELTQQTETL